MRTVLLCLATRALLCLWGVSREAGTEGDVHVREDRNAEGVRDMRLFREDYPGGAPRPWAGVSLKRLLENKVLIEELELTDEQLRLLRQAAEELKIAALRLTEQLKDAALLQARLLAAPTVDETAVMQAVEKAGSLRTDLAKLKMKELLTLKRTLKEEQQKKLRNLREKMRESAGDPKRRGEWLKRWGLLHRKEGRERTEGVKRPFWGADGGRYNGRGSPEENP